MRVAHVATEAAPLAKVGGLADVVGALPAALRPLGVEATVVLPWYRWIEGAVGDGEVRFESEGREEVASIGRTRAGETEVRLIDVADLARERIYGYPDDVRRFVRFSLAAAALVARLGPDVVHAHDWPTALLPVLGAGDGRFEAPSVLTIHNLAFQGRWNPSEMEAWTGLPTALIRGEKLEHQGDASLLKGAITHAAAVTTVSPTHAREILTPEHGHGLDGVLRSRADGVHGIVNGIDTDLWDPARDPLVPAAFDVTRPDGKAACRRALCEELGIGEPVLGLVSRLAWQKGLDVVLEALDELLARGVCLAVVASGDPDLEAGFAAAAARHPGRVAVRIAHDEALAHRVYAGSDALLIPSRYEPCGLTQLIAMRYGTLPIARAVGGLVDTIEDGATGYLFEGEGPEPLLAAVDRFLVDPDRPARVRRAMGRRSSWEGSARAYVELYRTVLEGT